MEAADLQENYDTADNSPNKVSDFSRLITNYYYKLSVAGEMAIVFVQFERIRSPSRSPAADVVPCLRINYLSRCMAG